MITNAFQDIVTAFSVYQRAIESLENELANTKTVIDSLKQRVSELEERGVTDSDMKDRIDMVLETNTFIEMLDDRVREAVDSYDFEDAIESALSGREITVSL